MEHHWEKVFTETAETSVRLGSSRPVSPTFNLLLVEDDLSSSMVMGRLLTLLGYIVEKADCVSGALAVLDRTPIDVVISDIDLPDGTGYELMIAVRARCDAVGIALTGFDDPDDLDRSRLAGFARHLVKPIDFKVLQKVLADLRM